MAGSTYNRPVKMALNADALLRVALGGEADAQTPRSAPGGYAEKGAKALSRLVGLTQPGHIGVMGDPSILSDGAVSGGRSVGATEGPVLKQALAVERFTGQGHEERFAPFVLPNGTLLRPQLVQTHTKQAFMPLQPAPQAQPNLQQAQQAMQSFMPAAPQAPQIAPQAPATPQTAAGMPAAAPGHQTMTGVAQRPLGLDQPCDTRATALPGAPGHAATNVIDQRGGLDPRGLTVDGNNAAGIKKFGAAEMQDAYERIMARPGANWFTQAIYNPNTVVGQLNLLAKMTPSCRTEKRAVDQSTRPAVDQSTRVAVDQSTQNDLHGFKVAVWLGQKDKRKRRVAGSPAPWMGLGIGAGAAGAYGLAQGLANDQQISRIRDSVSNYRPEAFTQGQLPPNQTGLTHYQSLLSPAAQLKPFGVPIGKALVGIRSDPQVMEAMGAKSYALPTPKDQAGVGGMAHYNMFANGPVPAYMHQLKARLADVPVPAEMGAPAGSRYSDWMGRKFEDFVANQSGQRINPFEVTTQFMPHEQQSQLMEQFHASLPPAEQAYRIKAEDPGPGYANQVDNYLPKAKGYADFRDNLRDAGIAGGGAAAGAIGGHMLYNGMVDEENQTGTGRTLASLTGAGLGGGAAYLGGTEHGRKLMGTGLNGLKQMLMGVKTAAQDTEALIAKGHGSWKCKCGASGSCRCSASHDLPEQHKETCDECEGRPKFATFAMLEAMNKQARFITRDELLNYKPRRPVTLQTADDFHRQLKRALGQEKTAHVEPLPRWVNPPSEPLDPEFVKSDGVQQLLRALHCEATPDGQIKALTIPKRQAGNAA